MSGKERIVSSALSGAAGNTPERSRDLLNVTGDKDAGTLCMRGYDLHT